MSAAVLPETCRIAVQTGLVLLLQTGLILLLGLGVGWALRRRGPQAQGLAYRATLLAVLCVAVLSPSLVHGRRALWRVSLPARAPVPSASPGVGEAAPTPEPRPVPVHALPLPPASATGDVGPVDAPPVALGTPHVHAAGVHTTLDVLPWAAGLWGAGTLALLAWLGLGQASLMVLRRRSVPAGREATDLLAHLCAGRGLAAPRLLVSSRVGSPFLAGLWRPAIFLPASYAQDFDADALRAILAHELGHWERRDNAWALLARLTCALFWPQPLLLALARRMAQAAEEACDALALAQGCSPRAYADCLLSLAERRSFSLGERAVGVGIVSFRSAVGRRIQTVLTQKGKTMPAISSRLRATVLVGAALAALAAGCLVTSSAPAQPAVPAIVGTWRGDNPNHKTDTVTFRADGTITEAQHSYRMDGTYQATGDSLTVTMTSSQTTGGKRQPITTTHATGLHFQLKGDTLTLIEKTGKSVGVLSRVAGAVTEDAPPPPPAPAVSGKSTEADLLAGLTPVQGPGLIVTLRDSKMPLPPFPKGSVPGAPNLIHDTDINQVVNELKASGAEAIAVNNQRLVGMSPIRSAGPTVYVNTTPQAPPFVIKAIGDPETLQTALNLPNGVADGLRHMDPAMISMQPSPGLTLPAYNGTAQPRYAHPVGVSGSVPHARQTPDEAARAAALRTQLAALLRQRAIYEEQLAQETARMADSQLRVASRPHAFPPRPLAVKGSGHQAPQSPIEEKKKFVRDVHAYNQQWVRYWNERAILSGLQTSVARRQATLNALNAQIRNVRAVSGQR